MMVKVGQQYTFQKSNFEFLRTQYWLNFQRKHCSTKYLTRTTELVI
jgi:hypothetical protein